jgi:hypothetical protein
MPSDSCRVTETTYGRHTRALVLENNLVRVVVLADKGADIYELTYKPRGVDVLWKAPWGLRELGSLAPSAGDSTVAWMDHYEGGWQEIFPSGGPACTYKGVEMAEHGELATSPWDYEIISDGGQAAEVRFRIALTRTPFRLERTMSLAAGRADIAFSERLVNEGAEPMDYMWGHHPAFGAPFLSGDCRLDVPARRAINHEVQIDPVRAWLADGGEWSWPMAPGRDGLTHDLSRVPGSDVRVNNLCYLADLREGWYGLTNTKMGFGMGLVWPKETFPYMWLWQELGGSLGYPFYGRCRVMGVEIWTSIPGSGLVKALKAGTAARLEAGGSTGVEFRCVLYESSTGVRRISPDGHVEVL